MANGAMTSSGGGIGEFFFGSPSGFQQSPRFAGDQLSALQGLLQQGLAGINPDAIEKRARSQFHQQTVPTLAERFTGLTGGRISSPAFSQQLGSAAAGLEEGLASQRAQMAFPLLNLGLQPQFETAFQQRSPGLLENLLMALIGAGGQAGGAAIQGHFQNQGLQNLAKLSARGA